MTTRAPFGPLKGLRVFVAEDEFPVLQLIEDMLQELGCTVADSASSVLTALDKAALTEAQVALLDVNLRGQPVFPVAQILHGRGIAIVFSTGYGRDGMEARWNSCPVVQKPFSFDDLESALRQALA